jgi:hypothetical protein
MNTRPSPFDTGEIDLDDDYYEMTEEEVEEMWARAIFELDCVNAEDLGLFE